MWRAIALTRQNALNQNQNVNVIIKNQKTTIKIRTRPSSEVCAIIQCQNETIEGLMGAYDEDSVLSVNGVESITDAHNNNGVADYDGCV